jgi:hypothetical protein
MQKPNDSFVISPRLEKRVEEIKSISLSDEANILECLMPLCLYEPFKEFGPVLSYSYNIGFLKAAEAKACSLSLVQSGFWLSNVLVIRHLIEIWSVVYEIERKIKIYTDNPSDVKTKDDFKNYSITLISGTRYFHDLHPENLEFRKARNILTAIEKLDIDYPDREVKKNYGILCEMCHPNFPLLSYMIGFDISKELDRKIPEKYESFLNLQLNTLESSILGIKSCLFNITEFCSKINLKAKTEGNTQNSEVFVYNQYEELLRGEPILMFSIKANAIKKSGKFGISIDFGKFSINTEIHQNISKQLGIPVKTAIDNLSYPTKLAISSRIKKSRQNKPLHIFTIDVWLEMADDGKSLWYTSAFIEEWAAKFDDIVQNSLYAREKCLEIICSTDFE